MCRRAGLSRADSKTQPVYVTANPLSKFAADANHPAKNPPAAVGFLLLGVVLILKMPLARRFGPITDRWLGPELPPNAAFPVHKLVAAPWRVGGSAMLCLGGCTRKSSKWIC